jgi:hypothetical protein
MVYPTSFARLDASLLETVLGIRRRKEEGSGLRPQPEETHVPGDEEEHDHDHGLADEFESFGRRYSHSFSGQCLESFFQTLKTGGYGRVVRAKGVFRTSEDWIRLELASGEVLIEPAPTGEYSAVSIIGQEIAPEAMDAVLTVVVSNRGSRRCWMPIDNRALVCVRSIKGYEDVFTLDEADRFQLLEIEIGAKRSLFMGMGLCYNSGIRKCSVPSCYP